MNLEDLRRKYLKSGFTPANASAKICQDIILNNNIFKRNLKDTKNNWLDIYVDEVVNNVINYFTYLEKIIV